MYKEERIKVLGKKIQLQEGVQADKGVGFKDGGGRESEAKKVEGEKMEWEKVKTSREKACAFIPRRTGSCGGHCY